MGTARPQFSWHGADPLDPALPDGYVTSLGGGCRSIKRVSQPPGDIVALAIPPGDRALHLIGRDVGRPGLASLISEEEREPLCVRELAVAARLLRKRLAIGLLELAVDIVLQASHTSSMTDAGTAWRLGPG